MNPHGLNSTMMSKVGRVLQTLAHLGDQMAAATPQPSLVPGSGVGNPAQQNGGLSFPDTHS
jgi:hypothetical protein